VPIKESGSFKLAHTSSPFLLFNQRVKLKTCCRNSRSTEQADNESFGCKGLVQTDRTFSARMLTNQALS
jgi:hypothetical protein